PPTSDIYTLSLHDALPICPQLLIYPSKKRCLVPNCLEVVKHIQSSSRKVWRPKRRRKEVHRIEIRVLGLSWLKKPRKFGRQVSRSEEHTSELQSRENLVCR